MPLFDTDDGTIKRTFSSQYQAVNRVYCQYLSHYWRRLLVFSMAVLLVSSLLIKIEHQIYSHLQIVPPTTSNMSNLCINYSRKPATNTDINGTAGVNVDTKEVKYSKQESPVCDPEYPVSAYVTLLTNTKLALTVSMYCIVSLLVVFENKRVIPDRLLAFMASQGLRLKHFDAYKFIVHQTIFIAVSACLLSPHFYQFYRAYRWLSLVETFLVGELVFLTACICSVFINNNFLIVFITLSTVAVPIYVDNCLEGFEPDPDLFFHFLLQLIQSSNPARILKKTASLGTHDLTSLISLTFQVSALCSFVYLWHTVPDILHLIYRDKILKVIRKTYRVCDVESLLIEPGDLHLEHITKSVGAVKILDDVTLKIPADTLVCITGESGKSTLIKILAQLTSPDSSKSSKVTSSVSRDFVGYMPQESVLLPFMTVMDTVFVFFTLKHGYTPVLETLRRILKQYGLHYIKHKKVSEVSCGERQMVSFCIAMSDMNRVILLDEPTFGMDEISRSRVYDQIRKNSKQKTVVIASNVVKEYGFVQKLVQLHAGKIVFEGNLNQLKQSHDCGHVLKLTFDSRKVSRNEHETLGEYIHNQLLQVHPEIRLTRPIGQCVNFILPFGWDPKDLLQILEARKKEFGIDGIQITTNTFEICCLRNVSKDSVLFVDKDKEKRVEYLEVVGTRSFSTQMVACLERRLCFWKRNWTELFVPVLLVAFVGYISGNVDTVQDVEISNSGIEELLIDSGEASCGCWLYQLTSKAGNTLESVDKVFNHLRCISGKNPQQSTTCESSDSSAPTSPFIQSLVLIILTCSRVKYYKLEIVHKSIERCHLYGLSKTDYWLFHSGFDVVVSLILSIAVSILTFSSLNWGWIVCLVVILNGELYVSRSVPELFILWNLMLYPVLYFYLMVHGQCQQQSQIHYLVCILFPVMAVTSSCSFMSTVVSIILALSVRIVAFSAPYVWSRMDIHPYMTPLLSRYFEFLPMELSEDGLNEQKKATQPTSICGRYKVVVRNIRKSIGRYDLLESFSMVSIRGDYISLIGQNDSGNNVILDVLSGFEESCCRCAQIYVNNLRDFPISGFISHNHDSWSYLSVKELIQFVSLMDGKHISNDDVRVLLEMVNLTDKHNVLYSDLSFNEKRKCQLIAAFAGRADVIAMDNPTFGLDVYSRKLVEHLIVHMNRAGTTFITASDDMEEVESMANTVYFNENGLIKRRNTLSQFRSELKEYTLKIMPRSHKSMPDVVQILRESFSSMTSSVSLPSGIAFSVKTWSLARCFKIMARIDEQYSFLNYYSVSDKMLSECFRTLAATRYELALGKLKSNKMEQEMELRDAETCLKMSKGLRDPDETAPDNPHALPYNCIFDYKSLQ